jgi:hypothetical protein
MSATPITFKKGNYQTSLLIIITSMVFVSILTQIFYIQPCIKNKEIDHSKGEQQMDTINLYSLLTSKMNTAINELTTTANLRDFKTMRARNYGFSATGFYMILSGVLSAVIYYLFVEEPIR